MARRAGVVTINLRAGTAEFFADMDRTNAKLREFGHSGVSEAKAVHAGLKVLEGGFANNTRAAAAFLEKIVGFGPIMQIAFPLVGAIALVGVLSEGAKKAYEFYKSIAEGPQRIASAFRDISAPLRLTNDELALANARLEQDIAKIEGRPENGLKIALMEARVEADRLADALERDLKALEKTIREKGVTRWAALFGGGLPTGDLGEQVKAFQESIVGVDDKTELLKKYREEIERVDKAMADMHKEQERDAYFAGQSTGATLDYGPRLDVAKRMRDQLSGEMEEIERRAEQADLTKQKRAAADADAAAKQERPFANELARLQARLAGVRSELAAVGQDHAFQVQARATLEADEALARLTARLKDMKAPPLTKDQEGQVRSLFGQIEAGKDQTAWGEKIDATVKKLKDETREQELLTAAIGKGYAAIRDASIEAVVMKGMGPERYDKDSADAARIRAAASTEYDSKHATAQAEALQNLREQIGIERSLAVAQAAGAAAVREAELQAKIARMELAGATKVEIEAERELAAAQHATAIAADIAKIDEQTEATNRLTAAIGKGAEAMRAAVLASRLAQIEREGDTPVPGLIGIGARGLAAMGADSADRAKQVAEAGARTDRVRAIDDEIATLQQAKTTRGDTLGIEMQLRDLENQRIHALAEESLALGTAADGVRAFFIEMQEQSRTTASIVYEALNSALDKTSENLMKLMTGQGKRSDWGKEFKDIGDQMAQSSIKSLMQKGLASFGIGGKELGSSAANPMWVRMAGGVPALAMPGGGSMSGAPGAGGGGFWSSLGKLFHIGGGGGDASSSDDFGGGMAEGGDVDPGHVYRVGEKGIEYFRPSTRGQIVPESNLGNSFHFHSVVDARGADLGMTNRINRAIEMAHQNAVATAVQATHERAMRVPGGGRR